MLQIQLLGKVEIRVSGVLLPTLRGKSGLWLLGILTLNANRVLDRDWLADILWPDSAPEQGRANLRRTLTDVRQALGDLSPRLTSPTQQTVLFEVAEGEADVLAFRQGDWERYGGDLLPGCPLQWVEVERRILAETFLSRGETKVAALSPTDALPLLERLRASDPLRESLLRLQLTALCRLGNRAGAQQTYHTFRRSLLERRLGEPSAQTQAHWKTLQSSTAGEASAPGSPSSRIPNNLPHPLTSFVGRELALAELRTLLDKTRLLTLTGVGGIGKTRLSLQGTAAMLEEYPDGVWLIELAALLDASLVPQTVAAALGVREKARRSLEQTLTDYLKPKNLLLVLDNCEHVLSACGSLVTTLLRACPRLKVLATSREPLSIAGELLYRVSPLTLPDPGQKQTVETLSQFEAVQLFIARAQFAKPAFDATEENAPALAQLCCRLDGIPLALELAAVRIRSLTVEQINEKLDGRFRLLTDGNRSALPRHQTLRGLIEWSYDLLTEPERILLTRLSIFKGGWMLEAAEKVCGFPPLERVDVLGLLIGLADKSLMLAEEAASEPAAMRYRMMETIHQYVQAKARTSGARESAALRERYLDWSVTFAEEAVSLVNGPEQAIWLTRLEREHDNLRTALGIVAQDPKPEAAILGLRLTAALWHFWDAHGYQTEGRYHLTRALAKRPVPVSEEESKKATRVTAIALRGAGVLATRQGDYAVARQLLEESHSLHREAGDRLGLANAVSSLANLSSAQGDIAAARSFHEESGKLYREMGHKHGMAATLNSLGNIAQNAGEVAEAQRSLQESLILYREIGDKGRIATTLMNLGVVALSQGDSAAARLFFEESLSIKRELGDKRGVAMALDNLGIIVSQQGDYTAAKAMHEEALRLSREVGDSRSTSIMLYNLGLTAIQQDDHPAARSFMQESLREFDRLGNKVNTLYALEGVAAAYAREGIARHAAQLWGAAGAFRESIGVSLTSEEQPEQDASVAKTKAAFNDELTFTAAWDAGRALSWEQAVALALDNPAPSYFD